MELEQAQKRVEELRAVIEKNNRLYYDQDAPELEDFEYDALNELSRLAAQYSDVNCTTEDINFYLERIARGTPIAKKAAQMSNEDLEQYLQSMREKKQGTLPAED